MIAQVYIDQHSWNLRERAFTIQPLVPKLTAVVSLGGRSPAHTFAPSTPTHRQDKIWLIKKAFVTKPMQNKGKKNNAEIFDETTTTL